MTKQIHRFFKTSVVYFAGQILSKLISLFLLPLYTSRIIPEKMGVYDYSLAVINLIVPIVFVQVWDGAFREAFNSEKREYKHFIINNSLFVCFLAIIPCICISLLFSWKYGLETCILIVLYGVLYAFQYEYSFSSRIFLNNTLFVASGFACTLSTAIINIVLIAKLNMGINALYISSIMGIIIQILIIEIAEKILINFRFADVDKKTVLTLIRFSIPLCISTISYWLLSGFTRMMINRSLGDYYNGIYSVTNKFAMLVSFVATALQYAWNEMAYVLATDSNKKETYSMFIDASTKTVFYGFGVLCLLIKIVFPMVIDLSYIDALQLIPIVMLGVAFNTIASLLSTVFMAEKKTGAVMISTSIVAAINVIFSIISTKTPSLNRFSLILTISFVLLMVIRYVCLVYRKELTFNPLILIDIFVGLTSILVFFRFDSIKILLFAIIVYGCCYVFSMKSIVSKIIKANTETK